MGIFTRIFNERDFGLPKTQMKRSGFKQPTYEQKLAKLASKPPRKPLSRISSLRSTRGTTAPKKGISTPKWLNKIPQGSHGSGLYQKKYWKVTSDLVRIADWYSFKGECISCPRRAESWKYLQAGHAKSWSACRGYSKWDTKNLFGQCPFCNQNGDTTTAEVFKEKIIERHGQERWDFIKSLDAYPTEKMENHIILEKIKHTIRLIGALPEQPEYYQEVIELLENE